MLRDGTIVKAYRVERLLRSGEMGSVYEVTHTVMRTRHAMKVAADRSLGSPAVRARFRREAQLMFALGTHPHIVRATDVLEDEELMALVIDYVDGGDLGEALDQRPGGLPWAEAWRILAPIVSAVAFAHEKHVVHRDLKPGHILLRKEGRWPGVPCLAGFGGARVLGAPSHADLEPVGALTCHDAPERARATDEVGPEADVWSLAMLAWRLVSGRLPVQPGDEAGLGSLHAGRLPVPRLDDVPEAVAHALSAALSVDPRQRPMHAGVLLKLLSPESHA